MVDLLIENGVVMTMDPERRIIGERESNGAVAIEKDRIVDVGTTEELRKKHSAKRTLDATKKLVMPGLIDLHGHSLGRFSLYEHLHPTSNPLAFFLKCVVKDEHYYTQGLMTQVDRLKFGTTCGVTMIERHDNTVAADRYAKAIGTVGTRSIISMNYLTGAGDRDSFEDFLSTTERVVQKYDRTLDGRLSVRLGPWWLGGAGGGYPGEVGVRCFKTTWDRYEILEPSDEDLRFSKDMGEKMKKLMDKYNVGMHTHASKGHIAFAYKAAPEAWLGPNVLLAHCRGISDEEIRILARTNTRVVHCPTVYCWMGCPPLHVPELLDAGVTVGLGCDHGIRPSFDLFKEMKTAIILQRTRLQNGWVMPPGKVLEMATIDAAKALGMDKLIGSIEPGKKADILLVNLNQPHLTPRFNLPTRLVYEADGHDVDTVIVDGKILMQGRQVKSIDEQQLLEKVQEEAAQWIETSGIEVLNQRPRDYWGHSRY